MSKRNSNRKRSNTINKSPAPRNSRSNPKPSQPRASENADDISQFNSAAVKIALEEGIEPESVETPKTVQNSDLEHLYREAHDTRSIYEQLRNKYETLTDEIQKSHDEIADAKRQWQEKYQILNEREEKLNQRDAEITRRETDATMGFLAQHEAVLEEVKAHIEALREAYTAFGSTLSDGSVALLDEHRHTVNTFVSTQREMLAEMREDYQQILGEFRHHWDQELQALNQREQHLMEREKALRSDERKLQVEREIQRENEEEREALTQYRLEIGTRELREHVKELESIKGELSNKLDQRVEELRQWDSLIKLFNGLRDPMAIKTLIEGRINNAKNDALKKHKVQNIENVERQLDEERDRIRQLSDERDQLKQQIAVLKRQNSDLQSNAWELEDAQLAKNSLEKSRELLQERIKDLQTQIDRITNEQSRNARPFEQCSVMDTDAKLQKKPAQAEQIRDLKIFAPDVQKTMENSDFYYEPRDVRSFIGGLAMSRLMILQGISGTGKTSLPIEFAKAVGGVCEVIEVQSSWRDREDLLGYYNSFERRFHERAMLTALYQAHCPRNRDRIFIILLDEMNLSYPEQYFADFLSVLERQETNDASLEIVSKHIDSDELPKHLISTHRGIQLRIPPNVWFVGTANRDETTKDIADKTYDRAHIIELPDTHTDVNRTQEKSKRFIPEVGNESLLALFKKAKEDKKHNENVEKTLRFLKGLRESMASTLPLVWGNRLEKQISWYVPVILECGGDVAEAVDHILATRILRKLRDRYDVNAEGLQKLQKSIDEGWHKFDRTSALERSNELLEREIVNKQRSL